MKKGWTEVALGEVTAHRNVFFDIDDLAEYKRCRVRLHAQGIELRDRVPGALIKTKAQQRCRPSDFLVAEIDAKVGGYGIVPESLDGAIVSSHYFLFEAHRSVLDPRFLGYFSRTRYFAEQVKARGSTNYAAIRPSHVLSYTIPLPQMVEQQRIVAHLDAIEARLTRAQKLREEAATEAEAFTTSLHLAAAKNRVVRLAQLLRLDEKQVAITSDGSYPQVGIRSFGLGLFKKPPVLGANTTYRAFNVLSTGQFVMSQVKGWEGALGVAGEDYDGWFASPEYRTFSCVSDECDSGYLSHIVATSWFRKQLLGATQGIGARRERVRPEMLLGLEMPFPVIGRQIDAVRLLEKQVAGKRLSAQAAEREAALLPSLLDRIFNT